MVDSRKIYVGEIGKKIKVSVGIPLYTIATVSIYVEKPDGSAPVIWEATVYGDESLGMVHYDTVDGDLNVPGIYRAYAKAVFSNGKTFFGERTFFNVYSPSEG